MKTRFLYLLLLSPALFFGQGDSLKKTFNRRPVFAIYGFYPQQLGETVFSEAYRENVGIGMGVSPFGYKNFRLKLNFERAQYRVIDHAKVAAVTASTYHSFGGGISYELRLGNDFRIMPHAGIAAAFLRLKAQSERHGTTQGFESRAGLMADYSLDKHISIFAGAVYAHTNFDVSVPAGYHDYYSKMQQLQLSLGLLFY